MFFNCRFSLIFSSYYKDNVYSNNFRLFKNLNWQRSDFVIINLGECFKSKKESLYSKLGEEKIVEKWLNPFILF